MQPVVSAGAGFLLAVLWFDLMFDVQTLRQPSGDLPEPVLVSITAYYRRVTTEARPMNRLIAAVMLATVVALVVQTLRDETSRWVSAVTLMATSAPIALGALRTVPSAVRLGARRDTTTVQSALARSVCRQHVLCLASIAIVLLVQLTSA